MKKNIQTLLAGIILVFAAPGVFAQSSNFNTPTTDVAAEKKLTVEGDFIAHPDKWAKGGFQTYGYRMIYGAGKKTEVGANFYYTRNGSTSPTELQLNAKYKIYESEKFGVAAASGAQFYIPLNRAAGNRLTTMFYANASKIVKQTGKTRLTGGFYTIAGANDSFGSKNGVIAGIEQPIKGKLSFAADWYSGKNRFGYSAAGFYYALSPKQYLMFGYNFGNTGRGNNGLAVYYGRTF